MLGDTIMLSSPEISIWSSAKEAYDAGNTTSGFYSIQLPGWTSPQQIYCDMVNNGGGWMLWYNRTAQAPFNNTFDLRVGPTGVGHWSGWENNSAPGLITSDWTDLNTEGYIHIWPHFNGSKKISLSLTEYLSKIYKLKFGEVLINSIDRDGTGIGLDFEPLDLIPNNFQKPIILSGGCGNAEHIDAGIKKNSISAISTANLLNFIGNGLQKCREQLIVKKNNFPLWDLQVIKDLQGYFKKNNRL